MDKRVQKSIFAIIIFIICFALTKFILYKFNVLENILTYMKIQEENIDVINMITIFANGVWSFLVAKGVDLFKIFLECKKEAKKEISEVSIIVNAVTCLRKTRRKDDFLDIDIGKGTYFIYVISKIKNVGARTIVECYINGERLEIISLEVDRDLDFCFRVCRAEKERYKKSYKIYLVFKDDKGISYGKKFKLKIDEEKQKAEIIVMNKLRRRL